MASQSLLARLWLRLLALDRSEDKSTVARSGQVACHYYRRGNCFYFYFYESTGCLFKEKRNYVIIYFSIVSFIPFVQK
jgi:hypothetical protein